jgi:octaprenyl-diphosphate synthase
MAELNHASAPALRAWYAPLGVATSPRSIPRAGLARGLAAHVATGFGARRRPRSALRGFTHILETYNEELYKGEPSTDAVTRQLAATTLRWWRPLEELTREQGAFIARVWARLSAGPSHRGDATFPECVLFLRAAVGVGALVADVPDDVYDALDRFAVALGLDWEATHGTLTAEGWRAGLSALGVLRSVNGPPELPADACLRARGYAKKALASLPKGDAVARLAALVERPPLEPHFGVRKYSAYTPYFPALPTPSPSAAYLSPGLAGSFIERWGPRLELALASYAASDSSAFCHAAAYLLAQRGKRVRGLLTLAAAAACGHDPWRALESAAAVEWLHQASLVLDDIIDRADMRRGSPALHSITSPLFAAFVTAFLLGRRLDEARDLPEGAPAMLLEAELSLLKGECLELRGDLNRSRTVSAYYRTIEAKTARLFACAASLGALAGGPSCPRAHVDALAKYGREVGLAFQIVDDLLDYAGDDAVLGKRVGTDFDNGIATLPLLLLEKATEVPAGADFAWIRGAMAAHSIPEACLARARRHIDAALQAVSGLPGELGVSVLKHVAETVLLRRK